MITSDAAGTAGGGAGRVRQGTLVLLLIAVAVVLGFVAATFDAHSSALALLVCSLPVVPIMLLRPEIPAVAALAVLPFESNVAPASVGVNVAVSDLLFAVAFVGLIYRYSTDAASRARLVALRPMLPLVAVYAGAAMLVTATHPGQTTLVNLLQRLEVIGVPLLIGATVLNPRTARFALRLFVVAAVVLAARTYTDPGAGSFLGVQKNPAGQYLADAAFLGLTCVRAPSIRYGVFGVLTIGIYLTHSRGALLGLLVGIGLYLLVTSSDVLQASLRIVPATVLAFVIFSLLPHAAQERLLGHAKTTEFNDQVRRAYAKDAQAIISEHPILGVGIGNYLAGSTDDLTRSNDPHDVALLEAAEGGYVLATAFAMLELGALVIVVQRRRDTRWAAVTVAVQGAILTHALVDVYWVRGTPVMGWVLIGLALATTDKAGSSQRGGADQGSRALVGS